MPGRVSCTFGVGYLVCNGVATRSILPGSSFVMATPKYYRNTVEIQGIEPGALWERIDDKMRLVDEDQFLEMEFDTERFTDFV